MPLEWTKWRMQKHHPFPGLPTLSDPSLFSLVTDLSVVQFVFESCPLPTHSVFLEATNHKLLPCLRRYVTWLGQSETSLGFSMQMLERRGIRKRL